MKKTIVVKLGSVVVVNDQGRINIDCMKSLVHQVCTLMNEFQIVIVSSGAVRIGRFAPALHNFIPKKRTELNYGRNILLEQIQASVGQPALMAYYIQAFANEDNVCCAQILATSADFNSRHDYLSLRAVMENLFEAGIVPIVNENDVKSPEELEAGDINDNDQLAAMIAAMVGADKLIILSNVGGFYDGAVDDPKSRIIPVIENIERYLEKIDDSSSQGKGGMWSKIETIRLIGQLGIEAHIASGFEPDVLLRITSGENVGSHFPTHAEKQAPYKRWLATNPTSKGQIVVSTTIAEILHKGNPASILYSGISSVEGVFAVDDVVTVYDDDRKMLGKGQVRFSSEDLIQKIAEYQASLLRGERLKTEIAIHYDKFVYCKN